MANQSQTNIWLLKTISLIHWREKGLQKAKNMFKWYILNRMRKRKSKCVRKIENVYSDIMSVLHTLISCTPITNKLAARHGLHIGFDEILSYRFFCMQRIIQIKIILWLFLFWLLVLKNLLSSLFVILCLF